MNLARLNHILIPERRDDRERLRRGLLGKIAAPGLWLYRALSVEGRVLALLSLFVGTAGIEVGATQTYVLWSAIAGVLLASLLARAFYRLARVRLRVHAAARVAVGEPITLECVLHNDDARDWHDVRIGAPFLPWDGKWLDPEPAVAELPAAGTARARLRARFVARGEHQLDELTAAALVPLGLALGPRIRSEPCRFVVVPRIAEVERVTLPPGRSYQPGGVPRASHAGEALELVGVRPYRAGDPVRDLHPKTWARTGVPHVREYQQEYFARIGVIVDDEAGSERGLEAAVSLAAGVVAALSRGEALVDLLVIGGDVHPLTLGRHLGFLEQALDLLACVRPRARIDDDDLLSRLEAHLAPLSCLVLITQSPDRAALADSLAQRGVGCRVLRVHDDTATVWARREPAPAGRHETVLCASDIESGALSL